jgi:hypothetical protein
MEDPGEIVIGGVSIGRIPVYAGKPVSKFPSGHHRCGSVWTRLTVCMGGTMGISQQDPVHIRVDQIDPFPLPDPSAARLVRLTFAILNRSTRRTYHLPAVWVAPYGDALARAWASQAVYWVDLDYTKLPNYPPPGAGESIPMRILKAVQNRQVVRDHDDRADAANSSNGAQVYPITGRDASSSDVRT